MLSNPNMKKKNKNHSQSNQNNLQLQKQNISTGLFDQNKSQIEHRSNFTSPTFQSTNNLSLKDAMYHEGNRQNYVSVDLNLKEAMRQQIDWEEYYRQKMEQKLKQHLNSKNFYKKLEKLLDKEGCEAMYSWSQAVEQYKGVKQQRQKYYEENNILKDINEKLKVEVRQLHEQLQLRGKQLSEDKKKIASLEIQRQQEKNQTRLMSQKKCKGCEYLSQKEKQFSDLFSVNKKQKDQLDKTKGELEENKALVNTLKVQINKIQQKYQNLMFLKQEVEKKNQKMIEKEKEWQLQKQKFGVEQQQSTRLHIQLEQRKEKMYQLEKTCNKLDEKYKRQINDLKLQLETTLSEKNILSEIYEKTKAQLNELKPKYLKMSHEFEDIQIQVGLKEKQCQDMRRRQNEGKEGQVKKRRQLEQQIKILEENAKEFVEKIKQKDEQLTRTYALLDETDRVKVEMELQINEERNKNSEVKRQINEKEQIIQELQLRLRKIEEDVHFTSEKSVKIKHNQSENFTNRRVGVVMSEMYQMLQIFKEEDESLPRMRRAYEYSQEREVSSSMTERQINEMVSELKLILNRYTYLLNENETLKHSIEQYLGVQQEVDVLKRNVKLKEQALCCLVGLTPSDLKDNVCNLLMIVQNLSSEVEEESTEELQRRINELKEEGRRWMEGHNWMEIKLRKLQEQNDELKRRQGRLQSKKVTTDYDSKEVRNRNDIKRKYNFD